MSFWTLTQILFNLILLFGVASLWIKLNRPPKDDPRLSRGLQLLQSKIAVLEDLSDRTESQVKQLSALIDQKSKEVHYKIEQAEKTLVQIEQAKQKSLEVAKIFQDKIPHKEIIERQNSLKYVQAARLAHQGMSVEEICEKVDLVRGEVELIAKMNRQKLNFDEEALPEWAKEEAEEVVVPPAQSNKKQALKDLGQKFRQAEQIQEITSRPASANASNLRPKDLGIQPVKFPVIEGV